MSHQQYDAELFARLRVQAGAHEELQQAWFDTRLFHCRSPRLDDYISETEENVAKLRAMSAEHAQYPWLVERIEQQLNSLVQALYRNRPAVAHAESVASSNSSALHALYAELNRYRGYEVRLADQLESAQQAADSVQQRQQVITARQRLQRCQKAIQGVERRIAALEAKL